MLAFEKSAVACLGIDAPPKHFILAQFDKFEEYGRHMRRTLYPQPHHLHGVRAMARFADYDAKREARAKRAPQKEGRMERGGAFALEERKLKSLMRVLRAPDTDVLVDRPEEFSPDFLEHKGVWDLVSEMYAERVG